MGARPSVSVTAEEERAAVLAHLERTIGRYLPQYGEGNPAIQAALRCVRDDVARGEHHLRSQPVTSSVELEPTPPKRRRRKQLTLPGANVRRVALDVGFRPRPSGRPPALHCARCEGRGWALLPSQGGGAVSGACPICGGVGTVAVARVAREAGVSRATIYRLLGGEEVVSREACVAIWAALAREFL